MEEMKMKQQNGQDGRRQRDRAGKDKFDYGNNYGTRDKQGTIKIPQNPQE